MDITKTIPDAAQRARAIQPDCSFIVQAPAGSGKTELLIQRYLKLLSLVNAPEEIIAITFTRKAAAEMKGRILNAIELARVGVAPEQPQARQTYMLARDALVRDEQLEWDIVDNPGRMRIQTIDSFCTQLVRQTPILSGMWGRAKIIEDPNPLYEQAAINTLLELEGDEAWSDSIARLLVHLDNNLPRVKLLIIGMLQKRDQWLANVLQAHQREDIEKSLGNLIEEKLARIRSIFPDEHGSELCELLRYAADQLIADGYPSKVIHCQSIEKIPESTASDLVMWNSIAELLLTKQGTWRIQLTKKNGFPSASDNVAESINRTDMKKRMQGLISQLRDIDGLESILAGIDKLPPAQYTDDEWDVVNALCSLLTLSAAQLHLLFSEQNCTDFIGMAQAAVTATGSDDAPTDLAMYLDHQIQHLLVDEFQDISVNQYQLLERLTAEWSEDDGRSLLMVGDPMQSIYRFREAEVGEFINTFHKKRLGKVRLEPLILSVNFRSNQQIVNWVNDSFSQIFPAHDDLTSGAVSFHQSLAANDATPERSINIHPCFNDKGKQEAKKTIQIIEEIKSQEPQASIAILVRSRSHLVDILPLLRMASIPFRAIEIESLGSRPAIQDMLALTRAWLHPADRIAWLSVLRAPWCGLDLKSLTLLVGEDRNQLIWQRCIDPAVVKELHETAQARLKRLVDIVQLAMQHRNRRPLRATIFSIWCALGGPAVLENKNDLDNVVTFLDLLEQLDRGGDINDLKILKQKVNQLYATADVSAGDNVLQVMTMHKAKGLEFDHVILPGLGRRIRGDTSDLLVWMLRPRVGEGHDLILAPIREAGKHAAPVYEYIQSVDKQKNYHEDARLLYVAITRSRKSLHMLGGARVKEDKNGELICTAEARSLLNYLWPIVSEDYSNAMSMHNHQGKDNSVHITDHELNRLSLDWQLPVVPTTAKYAFTSESADDDYQAEAIEYEWAGETIKHVGSVVHRCIQWMARTGLDAWSEERIKSSLRYFRSLLEQMGVPQGELDQASSLVEKALINMLEDDQGRWILSTEHTQPHNEYRITGIYKNKMVNAIVDRTFIDTDGTRWIVDYKTGRHEATDQTAFLNREQERYQEQLEKYATILKAMDDIPVKLGLYYPLLQGWREWEYRVND